ncbi:hypothetical protein F5148DRAFT_1370894, partial [Russula earlei]
MLFSSWGERVQALQIWQAQLYCRRPKNPGMPQKREYLLAQMKQKDELIDSIVKQIRRSIRPRHISSTTHYLATTLSIESYRNTTSSNDQHRQNVIAWLDGLRSSVRSPAHSAPTANPFHLDTRAVKVAGQSDESDEEPRSRNALNNALPRQARKMYPVSPNTLIESDIDPYPDDAVPIGLLANLAISTSRNSTSTALEKTRKENGAADDDEKNILVSIELYRQKSYFMPGPSMNLSLHKPLIDKTNPQDILVHRLTPDEMEKSSIRGLIRQQANALIDGWKSVELCPKQYSLELMLCPPAGGKKIVVGCTPVSPFDLNLHILPPKKPITEQQELEMLNRTWIWIICFTIDKSTATQFGKPSRI